MNSTQNEDINLIRCISNYLVILLHAEAVAQYCNEGTLEFRFWHFICEDLCQSALPALFFISGFLLFKNYNITIFGNKLKRRCKRLLIPYLSWNMFFCMFYIIGALLIPRLAIRVDAFQLNSFSGAIDKIISVNIPPIDGPLWFIRTLFLYTLISPLLYYFITRNKYLGFIVILIYFTCAYHFGFITKIGMSYPCYALLSFYLGGIVSNRKSIDLIKLFSSPAFLILSLIGLGIIAYAGTQGSIWGSRDVALLTEVGKFCVLPLLFNILFWLKTKNKINIVTLSKNKQYKVLKNMSFFAYASHFLFCSMLVHTVAPSIHMQFFGKETLLILLYCGGGTLIIYIIYKIICRFKFSKIFTGTL